MSKKIIIERTYSGFECFMDFSDDVLDAWNRSDVPGDFQGTMKIIVEYEPPKEDTD